MPPSMRRPRRRLLLSLLILLAGVLGGVLIQGPRGVAGVPHPMPGPDTALAAQSLSLTREECTAKFPRRVFLADPEARVPPMLYTFPGSGNTWVRLLMEHTTGHFTGSIYGDRRLVAEKVWSRGGVCSRRVIAVKIHPTHWPYKRLKKDLGSSACAGIREFTRAILVVRDPYDAIWSNYQRESSKSHTGGIQVGEFDKLDWLKRSTTMAWHYHHMLNVSYSEYMNEYPGRYIIVKYEDLKNPELRYKELRRIARFVEFDASAERLHCAFVLAESPKVHRERGEEAVTQDMAYTEELVCKMWTIMGAEATMIGYKPYGDFNCHLPLS